MSDEVSGERLADALKAYYGAEGDGAEEAALTKLYDLATHQKLTPADAFTLMAVSLKRDITAVKGDLLPLKRRVTELAARPKGLLYHGVYDKTNVPYERDTAVTYAGSCWAATIEGATSVPGTDEQWQLIAKKGRDARDR